MMLEVLNWIKFFSSCVRISSKNDKRARDCENYFFFFMNMLSTQHPPPDIDVSGFLFHHRMAAERRLKSFDISAFFFLSVEIFYHLRQRVEWNSSAIFAFFLLLEHLHHLSRRRASFTLSFCLVAAVDDVQYSFLQHVVTRLKIYGSHSPLPLLFAVEQLHEICIH